MPTKKKPPSRQCRPGDDTYVVFRNGEEGVKKLELLFGPFAYAMVAGASLCVPDRSLSPGWTLARYDPSAASPDPWVLGKIAGKHEGVRMLSFSVDSGEPPPWLKPQPVNFNV